MAVKNKMTSKERAIEAFRPSPKETEKSKLSNFIPKDSIFNKKKSFRMKGRDEVQTIDADWRNIALNGKKIVLIQDNAVSKDDLKQFSKEAKAYYLEEKKTAKAPVKAPSKPKEPNEKTADISEKVE